MLLLLTMVFIKDLAWGYNLKKASKSWLGYTQKPLGKTLGNKPPWVV